MSSGDLTQTCQKSILRINNTHVSWYGLNKHCGNLIASFIKQLFAGLQIIKRQHDGFAQITYGTP